MRHVMIVALLSLGTGCGSTASYSTVADEAPPNPELADIVYQHREGEIWIEGHFARAGKKWVWQKGHWEKERDGQVWRDGEWQQRGGKWHRVEGEWMDARDGYVRVRGHWQREGDGWKWIPGYWQKVLEGDTWESGRWQPFGDQWIWRVGRWRGAASEKPPVTEAPRKPKKK